MRVLTGSADAVTVMVGPAGTGKTFALDAVRQVFEADGYDVLGAAPSAKAAQELETDAHITSSTIHRLAGSWSRGYQQPDARTVLIVDEAAMAGLRDLDHIVAGVVDVGGRVVLVGDHHQLPEVTAGGGFAALATDPAMTVAALTVNRRQHHEWERDALAELRDGRVAAAVAAYRDHDRVDVVAGRPAMIETGVQRWLAAQHDGQVPVLLAGTNDTVDALNTAVRRELLQRGVLGPTVEGSDGALAIGERLMIRANDYRATTPTGRRVAVLNGQTATLTNADNTGLTIRMDHDDTQVLLTREHVVSGAVGYAYASTAHRARAAPGTWRSPSGSTASTAKPATSSCPADAHRTGSSSPAPNSKRSTGNSPATTASSPCLARRRTRRTRNSSTGSPRHAARSSPSPTTRTPKRSNTPRPPSTWSPWKAGRRTPAPWNNRPAVSSAATPATPTSSWPGSSTPPTT